MKTTMKLAGALVSMLMLGALAGCNGDPETEPYSQGGPDEHVSEAKGEIVGDVRLKFLHSGLCIGPASSVVGSPLLQKTCDPLDSSIKFVKEYAAAPLTRPTTQFRLRLKDNTNLCMHIGGPGLDNGAVAALYDCDDPRDNQWFNEDTTAPGVYGGIRAVHSDRCLAVLGSLTNVGSAVYQWGTPCTHDFQKILQYI